MPLPPAPQPFRAQVWHGQGTGPQPALSTHSEAQCNRAILPGYPGVSGPRGRQACPSASGSRCPQQYMGRGCHCPCREMGWPSPGVNTWTSPGRQLSWLRRGAGESRPSQHRSWWVLQGSGSLWGGVHRCQSSFQQGCALPQMVSFLAHPCRCRRSVSSRARAAAEVVGRVSTRRLLEEPLPAVRLQGVVCRPPCVSQPAHRHGLGQAGQDSTSHKPPGSGGAAEEMQARGEAASRIQVATPDPHRKVFRFPVAGGLGRSPRPPLYIINSAQQGGV